jgi:folate-binding protein YgfZ
MPNIDLTEWRRVLVGGTDARDWLEDLLTARISEGATRALLLTPTGRIRADVHLIPGRQGVLLIHDPIQPKPIDELLAPYVLSSDVQLGPFDGPLVGDREGDDLRLAHGTEALSLQAFDEWRIHEGLPRFGMDLDEDSLPQEAGWERFIDFTKGCFMGQEAMAKIRNMSGHPTRVIRALRADAPVAADEPVVAAGDEVGIVTSAAGTDVIVRIRWAARDTDLATAGGIKLLQR